MFSLLSRLLSVRDVLRAVWHLPPANLCFYKPLNPAHVAATYRAFTRPHPKYLLFRNKAIGAALIDIADYASAEHYATSIGKRNFGGYFASRAKSRGYRFMAIDRNDYVNDIDAINNSLPERQGKAMAPSYQNRVARFVNEANYRYYGVVDQKGKLMAYCELGIYGNFALLSRLLGYRNNDGIMHFMIVEIIGMLISERSVRYAMYDTWFGASEGLRNFKTILGFKPYRVKYSIAQCLPFSQSRMCGKTVLREGM